MKVCPTCFKRIEEDAATTCPSCGKRLDAPASVEIVISWCKKAITWGQANSRTVALICGALFLLMGVYWHLH
ncbi:MAG: hypothetical protein ACHQ9S_26695 [Candidatus Binatia bacterium]